MGAAARADADRRSDAESVRLTRSRRSALNPQRSSYEEGVPARPAGSGPRAVRRRCPTERRQWLRGSPAVHEDARLLDPPVHGERVRRESDARRRWKDRLHRGAHVGGDVLPTGDEQGEAERAADPTQLRERGRPGWAGPVWPRRRAGERSRSRRTARSSGSSSGRSSPASTA